jgi:hypothetical protein
MRWIFALALLLLASCSYPAPTPTPSTLVQWDRSPQAITFRADVVGGESEIGARNAIPNCTIYGDNRVVWSNPLSPFEIQVLEDRLSDKVIDDFVQYLTVDERIYTFDGHDTDGTTPVENVWITVSGATHHADSISGWGADWYPRVRDACKNLSKAPVLVAPSSGWLSAQPVEFNPQFPLSTWNGALVGQSLSDIAGGKSRWISGEGASWVWNTLHSLPTNLIFDDAGSYFQVALQVPGVNHDAPPALSE